MYEKKSSSRLRFFVTVIVLIILTIDMIEGLLSGNLSSITIWVVGYFLIILQIESVREFVFKQLSKLKK